MNKIKVRIGVVLSLPSLKRLSYPRVGLYYVVLFGFVFATNTLFSFVGLDLTDEGLALQSVSDNSPFRIFNSPFGLPLSYLWDFSGQNISQYRFLGSLLLVIAALFSSKMVFNYVQSHVGRELNPAWVPLLSFLSWATYTAAALPTPNYNYLTYMGSLLFLGGVSGMMLSLEGSVKTKKIVGRLMSNVVVTALGLALGFYGRFSAFIILFIGVVLFWSLYLRSPKRIAILVLGVLGLALIMMASFSMEVGAQDLFGLISQGAQNVISMDSTYNPVRSVSILIHTSFLEIAFASVLTLTLVVLGYAFKGQTSSVILFNLVGLIILVFFIFAFIYPEEKNRIASVLLFGLTFFGIVKYLEIKPRIPNKVLWLALLSWFGVLSCTIGGNTGISNLGLYAGPAIGTSLLILSFATSMSPSFQVRQIAIATIFGVAIALGGVHHPYRQPALYNQTQSFSLGKSTIFLDQERATEINFLRECLRANGLTGKLTLDFTGNFAPGLIFALEGGTPDNLLGTIWGYDGSEELMRQTIQGLSSDVNVALLLFDTGSKPSQLTVAENLAQQPSAALMPICISENWEIRVWNR